MEEAPRFEAKAKERTDTDKQTFGCSVLAAIEIVEKRLGIDPRVLGHERVYDQH